MKKQKSVPGGTKVVTEQEERNNDFYDGTEKEIIWQERSRRDSWTDEMKQKARSRYYADCNANPGDQG